MNMTPAQIVSYLDEYIIGQKQAKKMIAMALRNRYRRMQLPAELQEEITPKNILMIGSTGVGKTEIARRLAKLMRVPFIKVEASKYTEVGYVGRDVESMIRDLVLNALSLVKEEYQEANQEAIDEYVLNAILDQLLPPLKHFASPEKESQYHDERAKMKTKIHNGLVDEQKVTVTLPRMNIEFNDTNMPPEMAQVQESFGQIFGTISKGENKKVVSVKEAKKILRTQASEKLLDNDAIRSTAIERAQEGGIIFLDEIDKIAIGAESHRKSDPGKEGVQRDLLPIVEGSTVNTKYGQIKTDHILFIAAGAFHVSRPSDLIPELQGRFPLRVELESLTQEALYKILTQTKNSLLSHYQALLSVEGIELGFEDEAIRAMAHLCFVANEKTEDIGARRLHTIVEKVLEDISFHADTLENKKVTITATMVHEALDMIIESEENTRYIL
ncbi:MAG: ATP-dependent protease [Sulfuricurvum sp. PC08-66]|nr:MAG: ATP-dependent protease [Sulfuricurvum sp. PC08-66]